MSFPCGVLYAIDYALAVVREETMLTRSGRLAGCHMRKETRRWRVDAQS